MSIIRILASYSLNFGIKPDKPVYTRNEFCAVKESKACCLVGLGGLERKSLLCAEFFLVFLHRICCLASIKMPGKKGAAKAEPKADSQPEKAPEVQEEKAPEEKEETTVEKVEETKNPEKRGRGRPKKSDGSEPSTKKPKKIKEKSPPSRVSKRVANMKSGVTEPPLAEQEPKKKDVSSKKAQPKAQEEKKELAASNGATEQAVES